MASHGRRETATYPLAGAVGALVSPAVAALVLAAVAAVSARVLWVTRS